MREIKFRGRPRCGKWIYGDLLQARGSDNRVEYMIMPQKPVAQATSVDRDTIGQFTGCYDVRHKAIYEGDIIRNTETLFEYEVAYAAPRFVRVADGGVVLDLPISLWTEQYYLIVGNTADGYVPNKKEAAAV